MSSFLSMGQKKQEELYSELLDMPESKLTTSYITYQEYFKLTHRMTRMMLSVSDKDSINRIHTLEEKGYLLNNAYVYEINYNSLDSLLSSISFLNAFNEHYRMIDHESYKEIVNDFGTGVIIAFDPDVCKVMILYLAHCVEKAREERAISILKSYGIIANIYVVSCGGAYWFKRVD
jgi:hypothetical protein